MKAVIVKAPGGPEQLMLGQAPSPEARDGEVLVDIHAAGVNRADILQRQGHYPPPPGTSEILGLEISGVVATNGTDFAVGDRVCALLAGGGYAGQATVPEGQLLRMPDGMSFEAAAALPEALCTVYYNLVLRAGLKAGEMLLIHGGGGGIGTMAIQVAKALGARVACTAGSAAKLDAAAALGAEILINYRDEDFVERIGAAGGADVILDIIGAKYLPGNVRALRRGGRLVVIGLQGGRKGELDLAQLLAKQGCVHATSLRALPAVDKAAIVAGVRADLWPLVAEGRIRPVVDQALPLESVAEAHRRIESGQVTGKLVLSVA